MAQLVVSIWNRHGGKDIDSLLNKGNRLELLTDAVAKTQSQIDQAKFDAEGLIKGIFAAPEYYFSFVNAGETIKGVEKPRSVSWAHHDLLVRRLVRLSKAHPRILIVPGTIAHCRPFNRDELEKNLKYYEGRATHRKVTDPDEILRLLRLEYKWSRATGKLSDSNTRYLYRVANGVTEPTDPITEAEFRGFEKSHPGTYKGMVDTALRVSGQRDKQIADAARDLLKKHTLGGITTSRIMQNTAHVLLNGRVVLSYSKQGNFNEEFGDKELVFARAASGVAEIEQLRFGFEVCLDHNIGMLGRQLRGGKQLDVQLITSDYVSNNPANFHMRDGGFLVHASTEPSVAGVWEQSGGNFTTAPKLATDKVGGTNLVHYEMDIDVDDPFSPGYTTVVSHQKWMEKTKRNIFHARSGDLEKVDQALKAYEDSEYMDLSLLNKLRTAFKAWYDKNPKERTARNADGVVERLKKELTL